MSTTEPSLRPADWHRRFCRVTPWLALSGDLDTFRDGGDAQLTEWIDNGITHIVDLRGEWSDESYVAERAPDIEYHWLGTHDDGTGQSTEWFDLGLAAYRAVRASDGCAMVHCHMGINRGPSMGYRWLLEAGVDPVEALDLIRTTRPIAGIIYARDALAHFHRTNDIDPTTAAAQRAAVEAWFDDDHVDIAWVISRVRRAETI